MNTLSLGPWRVFLINIALIFAARLLNDTLAPITPYLSLNMLFVLLPLLHLKGLPAWMVVLASGYIHGFSLPAEPNLYPLGYLGLYAALRLLSGQFLHMRDLVLSLLLVVPNACLLLLEAFVFGGESLRSFYYWQHIAAQMLMASVCLPPLAYLLLFFCPQRSQIYSIPTAKH